MILSIFSFAFLPFVYLLWQGVYSVFSPFFNWVTCFLKSSLCISNKSFITYVFCKDFLPGGELSCDSFNHVFPTAETLIKSDIIVFFLSWIMLLVLYLKTHCQMKAHLGVPPFSFSSFIVLYITFRNAPF